MTDKPNTRPTTVVTDEVVEPRDALIAAYIAGATAVHEWWSKAGEDERAYAERDEHPDFVEAAHDYASMPTVVTGEQPEGLGDHALPPSGLSQSSLSQAKPAAAIARKG